MKLLNTLVAVAMCCMGALVSEADEYVIDNDDGPPGYTSAGTWNLSTSTGYNDGQYWYSHHTYPPSYAIWTPNIAVPDRYEVFAIFRKGGNRTTDAPFTLVHADGTDVVHINMYGSSTVQEVSLGEYDFNAGTSGYVRLDNNGGAGYYISDAVKFVTAVDDPPEIDSLHHLPNYPTDSDTVTARARIIEDGSVSSATMYYSSTPSGTSGSVTAFDDGAHNDGAAGDDLHGASIPPQPDGDTVVYYFAAIDDASQAIASATQSYVVGQPALREYRSIWVDSWSEGILDASQCDELIQTCRDNNLNTVMAEIRKIGDAYYNSNIEPRATNITGGPTFDPLGYLINIAHDTSGGKKYIEMHGWFVSHRISAGETLDPQHILMQHPEYIMSDSVGSTTSSGNSIYLDPGHPGAVDHNVAVIVDCLSNYDIDGINLDYIRYPGSTWGYNPTSVARFNAFYGKSGQPSTTDADWADWRRECVTLEVKKTYIKSLMIDPSVVLTVDAAAWGLTYNNFLYTAAYTSVFQDWAGWLQQGIIDYNALMNYTTDDSRFAEWCDFSLASDDRRGSIIGMCAYRQSTVQDSMNQLSYTRSKGAAGLNIYDWYSEARDAPGTRADFYNALKTQLYSNWSDPPVHSWKTNPTTGIFQGNLTFGGAPVDHGTVMIDGQPDTSTYTDGSGWFAIMEVLPGAHTLRFSKFGYLDVLVPANLPAAGDIVTVNADFASSLVDWLVY